MIMLSVDSIVRKARRKQLQRSEDVMKCVNDAQKGRDVERDGFAEEMALQYGFDYLDDDTEVLFVRAEALRDMMAVLGFRTNKELRKKYGPAVSAIKGAMMRAREDEGGGP